ncbi:DMT family transporter [Kaistia dalseonensis]|uniref:Drug/metabolite transporter (DMT)-like permease n=1 Tax=Kaistia dalseonensis TaxID=410840 RepID=A0ABU0H359_9HYPH|nr:DMT family transporter [Kaistia dalseonensis]MCX5493386.1 DMT family transporter [Kaistia dalseonensis]MDQ0435944.1 drug/metabolite transporter (DMT)-like permease [Kaistia dalseonensis]
MTSFANNARGIIMMTLSNLVFIFNDTLIKIAAERLAVGQILVLRGAMALVVIGILLYATGGYRAWRMALNRLVAWRTVGEVGAAVLYLYALFRMPIANVSAIGQVVPLMTTAAAAIFLGEAVGWRRWTAVGIGFIGVMLIMRPGVAGFDIYSVAALASMGFITMRDLVTRRFEPGIPTLLVIAVTAAAVMLSGLVVAAGETWPAPTGTEWLMLLGASTMLLAGYGTSILAMRYGEMSVVAPFRYSGIVFAIIIGYVIWSDVPDIFTIAGTLIVVATGIYTFNRERRIAQAKRAEIVSPSSA